MLFLSIRYVYMRLEESQNKERTFLLPRANLVKQKVKQIWWLLRKVWIPAINFLGPLFFITNFSWSEHSWAISLQLIESPDCCKKKVVTNPEANSTQRSTHTCLPVGYWKWGPSVFPSSCQYCQSCFIPGLSTKSS